MMEFIIKELNPAQIVSANNNSMSGKRGDISNHEYHYCCEEVISWKLSDAKTQKILNKLYETFSKSLSLESQHVSVAVAGASNYNAKKLDKSDRILSESAKFVDWFYDLKIQATAKPYSRIEWLKKNIVWGVTENYSVTKDWKELAARSVSDFRQVYEELNVKYPFSKSTLPYKIYHGITKIHPIKIKKICNNGDFKAWSEDNYTFINFRLKVMRQMVVALKSRGFIWINSRQAWRSGEEGLAEWVQSIPERYADYI